MRLFNPTYPPIPWPVRASYGGNPRHHPDDPDWPSWKAYWGDYVVGPGFTSRWRAIRAVIRYRWNDRR